MASLLASPVSWLHHFVWIVPLAFSLVELVARRPAVVPPWLVVLGWTFVGWVVVRGAIHAGWGVQGFETGRFGYPVTDERPVRGGAAQTFQGGVLTFVNGQVR